MVEESGCTLIVADESINLVIRSKMYLEIESCYFDFGKGCQERSILRSGGAGRLIELVEAPAGLALICPEGLLSTNSEVNQRHPPHCKPRPCRSSG